MNTRITHMGWLSVLLLAGTAVAAYAQQNSPARQTTPPSQSTGLPKVAPAPCPTTQATRPPTGTGSTFSAQANGPLNSPCETAKSSKPFELVGDGSRNSSTSQTGMFKEKEKE